jgi:hypothetical protein
MQMDRSALDHFFVIHQQELLACFFIIAALCIWWGTSKSGWRRLARVFPTKKSYLPFGPGPAENFSSDVVINNVKFEGVYAVPYQEGVLFTYCMPGISYLYPKFLIPWNKFQNLKIVETKILNVTFQAHEVTVRASNENFIMRLPHHILNAGKELGFFKQVMS